MGEHTLSCAAIDAALDATKTAKLLLSESLTARARVLVGRAAATAAAEEGSGPHWGDSVGKQRLSEVMGRMGGDKQLLEKLLLHGL